MESRYYEVMTLMGEAEGEEAEKLSKEYDELQTAMDTKGIWDLDSRLEQAAPREQRVGCDCGRFSSSSLETGLKTVPESSRRNLSNGI